MRNSDVMCGALRIAHFEVKEDSGSLTFEGAIPDDVKSFSATLYGVGEYGEYRNPIVE